MSVRGVCAQALKALERVKVGRRAGLAILVAWTVIGGGLLVAPSSAQAQSCSIATPVVFTALSQTQSLVTSEVQACDEFIDDASSWGGFFTTSSGDAYNYFGLGVDDFTGAPQPEEFATANARYEFTGNLSNDAYTIRLVAVLPGATATDTISLFMCPGPENTTTFTCATTQVTTISVELDVPPTITTTTLVDGTAGAPYSQTLAVTGVFPPYVFSQAGGTLPPGITLSSGGVISGTSTAAGPFSFTARVTDAEMNTDDQLLSLTIAPPTLTVAPATLPDPVLGVAYSQAITATDGVGAYTYAATGDLPIGLTLATDGTLSGTPTGTGAFTFTVTATDSTTGTAGTGSQAYTVTVAVPTLTLTPPTMANIARGDTVSTQFVASGGLAPYAYVISAGATPTGVTLSPSGLLSGVASASGTFNFTVTATDSSTGDGPYTVDQAISLEVTPPVIVVPTLPDGVVYTPYTTSASASGGVAPYTFSLVSGSLPTGLTMAPDGTITGTPTTPGPYSFTIRATDSSVGGGGPYTGDLVGTINIAPPTITIPAGSPPAGFVTVGYMYAIPSPTGGQGGYTFAVTGGSFPPGLSLSAAGDVTGIPTTAGSYTFDVTATDGGGFTGSRSFTISVGVEPAPTVPTLTEWAMMLLAALLAGFGALTLNRRRTV